MNAPGVGSPARGVPFPVVTGFGSTIAGDTDLTNQLDVATPLLQDLFVWNCWVGPDGVVHRDGPTGYDKDDAGPFALGSTVVMPGDKNQYNTWMEWRSPVTSELAYESPHVVPAD